MNRPNWPNMLVDSPWAPSQSRSQTAQYEWHGRCLHHFHGLVWRNLQNGTKAWPQPFTMGATKVLHCFRFHHSGQIIGPCGCAVHQQLTC